MAQTKILDFGNAYLKSASTDHHEIDIKPSCIYYLSRADIRNGVRGDDASPLISLPTVSFLVGDAAASFNGSNNWSLESKLSVTREGLYSSVSTSQVIDRLIVCVPDRSIDIDLTDLVGLHSYQWNGSDVQIDIRSIETVDESLGAFLAAKAHLFNYPTENNVVITCGGGTVNLVVYNGSGNIIHRAVSRDLGMATLAKSIVTELKSLHNLPTTPKVAAIMAGIASEVYQLRPMGLDYSAMFEAARDDWRGKFRQFANDNLSDVDYCEFCIVGGGAELLKNDLDLNPAVHIPTNTQTYAIEGLLYHV
jgi:hypothetical protein